MRTTLLLLLLIFTCSCKDIQKQKPENQSLITTNFDWLLGDWQRTNEEPGLKTFEYWKKINDSEYAGLGIRLQAADTLFQERIKLVKIDKNWQLEVITKEDSLATVFKVTKIETHGLICENPLNEFPKKIHYYINNDKLEAIISGDEQEVPFHFKRIDE